MRVIAAGTAIAFGLLVLLGYFFPVGILLEVRLVIVQWAVILAAIAVLVGILNLFSVHWRKVRTRQKSYGYSILLIISLFAAAVLGIFLGPTSPSMQFFLNAVIVPAAKTLMALLAVTLVYASMRLFRRRIDLMTVLFLGVAVVVLLAAAPLPFGKIPGLSDFILPWITQVFATGGARGLLIGVALGALTTGVRVLLGIDRPYGGK